MSTELFFTHRLLKANRVTPGDWGSDECDIGLANLNQTPHLQLQQHQTENQLQEAVTSRDTVTFVGKKKKSLARHHN